MNTNGNPTALDRNTTSAGISVGIAAKSNPMKEQDVCVHKP